LKRAWGEEKTGSVVLRALNTEGSEKADNGRRFG